MALLLLASESTAFDFSNRFVSRLTKLSERLDVKLVAPFQTSISSVAPIDLPSIVGKLPTTPTVAWRDQCKVLVDAIDAVPDLSAIFVFDERSLRTLTATRVPNAPIIWMGSLAVKNLSLYTQAALRLSKAIFLDGTTTADELKECCGWQKSDPQTLPTICQIPDTDDAWCEMVVTLLQTPAPFLPAQIEHALREKRLPFLGGGSRRVCHLLGDSGLCVKFYWQLQDLKPTAHHTVRREIERYAHHRKRNTSCQEFDYFQSILLKKPVTISTIFPEIVDVVYLPSYGWGLIETFIANADGSPAIHFPEYLQKHRTDASVYNALVQKLNALCELFCNYAIHFYDFQNVLVVLDAEGKTDLKIADFEPQERQLISLERFSSYLLRKKIYRRYRRTFVTSNLPFGIESH